MFFVFNFVLNIPGFPNEVNFNLIKITKFIIMLMYYSSIRLINIKKKIVIKYMFSYQNFANLKLAF